MLNRVDKLRAKMKQLDYEAVLITKPENRYYLSGFSGTAAKLLITAKTALLITDFRYLEQAKEEAKEFKIVKLKDRSLTTLKELVDNLGIKELAFEAKDVSYQDYQDYQDNLAIRLKASNDLVESLRMIKDQAEIEKIKQAVKITDDAFKALVTEIKLGMSEKELALKLEMSQKEAGSSGNAFDFIVASGKRSALPHGVASDKQIAKAELITFDLGAVYQGYHSDMTRTVFTGRPKDLTGQQQEIYQVVLEAQQAALAKMKAGMTGAEVDQIAREIIVAAGYGDYFGHGLGHSVGLEIHEQPRLSKKSDQVLKAGMVVTVEPGIYLPEKEGVRIEDLVVVKDDGIINLTDSSKDLLSLNL